MEYPPLPRDVPVVRHDDPAQERLHRKRQTALSYRIFAGLGWGQTGDGHISARDPERTDSFWLLRYGVPFRDATIDDLVLVGPDGSVIDGPEDRTTDINETAYFIHMPVHDARPEVVTVAHTHTGYGTPWCAVLEPFEAISQEACSFVFSQSIFMGEEVGVGDFSCGQRIAEAMGSTRLCMLRNHGLLTAGETVEEAIGFFVMAERVAETHIKAGDRAKPISDEMAKTMAKWAEQPVVGRQSYEYLARTLVPDPSVVG